MFLAASTHPGEEPLIQQVHDALRSRILVLTIIAPRHPERGGTGRRAERSEPANGPAAAGRGVWIADTLGELGLVVPAQSGRIHWPQPDPAWRRAEPVGAGPPWPRDRHRTVSRELHRPCRSVARRRRAGGDQRRAGAHPFADAMLADPEARRRMGERARRRSKRRRACRKRLRLLELTERARRAFGWSHSVSVMESDTSAIVQSAPRVDAGQSMIRAPRGSGSAIATVWQRDGAGCAPFSCVCRRDHRAPRGSARLATAPVPVICCGNATVGGAGKTTLALDLAHRLTARGIAVHILLRGYRRHAAEASPRACRANSAIADR